MDISMNVSYKLNIYERYRNLQVYNREYTNYELAKIFEYYTCIKLTEIYGVQFYEYDDIDPTFKENNEMSRYDTGIDCCNLTDTIVQCKLRNKYLSWQDCGTFFASQNIFCNQENKTIIRWNKLILSRNNDCHLTRNLLHKQKLYIDHPFDKTELLNYCNQLLIEKPTYPTPDSKFEIRDYQQESINLIKNSKNSCICLPTGSGKNYIIINSMDDNEKYLILVPRIILMDQLYEEIIKFKPHLKNNIQLIGDGYTKASNKLITICVYNSIDKLNLSLHTFKKIYIDEAHHINLPEIYDNSDRSDISINSQDEDYCSDLGESSDSDESVSLTDSDSSDCSTDSDSSDSLTDSDSSDCSTDSDSLDSLTDSDSSDCLTDSDSSDSSTDSSESDKEIIKTENNEIPDNKSESNGSESLNMIKYRQIIKSLQKYNNNVYLSATIDEIDGFDYYKKDIREMITKDYLCDYIITVPIFSNDPDHSKIAEYILNNYKNMIIYCANQKEGKIFNDLLNNLQPGISNYIDCYTTKLNRKRILNHFDNGNVSFIVNVRILEEGFNSPITKGVIFLHMPANKTKIIQIIGRALRKHPTKQFANIVLPCLTNNDTDQIIKFLNVISDNDCKIKNSMKNKKLGGYVNLHITQENQETNKESISNSMFLYDKIYSSFEVENWKFTAWYQNFNKLVEFIKINKKRPSECSNHTSQKILGQWLSRQIQNYKNKIKMMKNNDIYEKWTNFINEYKIYFLSNKEIWNNNFIKLKDYINNNKQISSEYSTNQNTKQLGKWLDHQKSNYKKKINIMRNKDIYDIWTEYISSKEYSSYFQTNIDKWHSNFNKLKAYMDQNITAPLNCKNDNKNQYIISWLKTQKQSYKQKKKIMKNKEIYNIWHRFINDPIYQIYFQTPIEKWHSNFNKLKEYIDLNKKRPSDCSKNQNIKQLAKWLYDQKKKL